jgi:hypothetical protein
MREPKCSIRAHEKALAALYVFLISIITLRVIRRAGWFKQRKLKRAVDKLDATKCVRALT